MAQRRGGYQGSFERCGRCRGIASKWSVYSDRMLCNSCLSFERTAHEIQEARQAQATAAAAELEGAQAEYQRIDIANAAHLRSVANESNDPANAEYFGQQAKFYEDRAAQRAGSVQ